MLTTAGQSTWFHYMSQITETNGEIKVKVALSNITQVKTLCSWKYSSIQSKKDKPIQTFNFAPLDYARAYNLYE